VVPFLRLDAGVPEPVPQSRPLRLADAKRDVRARPAGLVDREPSGLHVGHQWMALGTHDPRAQESFVERRGAIRVLALDCDMVESCHRTRVFHVVLIVNPFASRVSDSALQAVERSLSRNAVVEIRKTQQRGHGVELARSLDGADALVVLGGDGVVNEVLNGIGRDIPFAPLPGGGTSVFARALGFPRDPAAAAAQAAEALAAGRTRRISLGRVNGRRFSFSAGIGLDAAAVRRVDALGRSASGRRAGDLAFGLALARVLAESRGTLEPVLELDGLGRAAFALVAKCDPYTYAGPLALHIAPQARFELGVDVVAPKRLSPIAVPRYVRYVLRGKGQERDDDIIYAHDLDRLEIRCDRPLPVQADGEDLGDADEVLIEAERGALTVLA
jgi:diacylglycerol kinase family enzyme